MRLDSYIVYRNSDISRSRAKTLIESGSVCLDGKIIDKPSYNVDETVEHDLAVRTEALPYVSRGGLKLEGAIRAFGIDPNGKVCVDIGASTGGFTDCLLKHGAVRVYAIDSGSDQLASKLKEDDRVVSVEKFNARNLVPDTIGEMASLAVADLSFISQTYIISAAYGILCDGGEYIGLIKPQFECGRSALGKNGIVKDPKQHAHAVKKVLSAAEDVGFEIVDLIQSPIKGGDGNREFLFHAVKKLSPVKGRISEKAITELVKSSGGH